MDKSADAYRTISEVAEELKLPQHVLRFWETRFPQVKPMKRGGNRRFYRPEDVELLRAIRAMLYGDGYTIKGVQRILKQQGPRSVAGLAQARPNRLQGHGATDSGAAAASGRADTARSLSLPARLAADAEIATTGTFMPDLARLPADGTVERLGTEPARPPHAVPAGYSSFELSQRLQAVLYDIAECERLLAASRS